MLDFVLWDGKSIPLAGGWFTAAQADAWRIANRLDEHQIYFDDGKDLVPVVKPTL